MPAMLLKLYVDILLRKLPSWKTCFKATLYFPEPLPLRRRDPWGTHHWALKQPSTQGHRDLACMSLLTMAESLLKVQVNSGHYENVFLLHTLFGQVMTIKDLTQKRNLGDQ